MVDEKEITKVQELVYELKVGQVMVKDVITVTPHNLMSELRDLLRDKRISGVPVVDKGRLVGLVSIEDFIKCLTDGKMGSPVEERMNRNVKTLYDNEPLVHAVKEFDRMGYGRFPVVDRESGKLMGIITKGDIIRGLLKKMEIDYQEEEIHRYRASHFFEDIVADKTTLIFQYNVIGKDFDRAGETSSGLKKTLRRMGISPKAIRRLAIATYEAEMNIVVFTDGGEITARVTPQEVRVEVVDSGPGIPDIKKAMEPGFSTAPDWIRELGFGAGMGLANIRKCADAMHLESTVGKGTRLEITVYLNEKEKHGSGNDS
ncbi:CBS domain-containing protein [candidate division KSB1 bacterium]|nr:CBS domain-containing protein [candidate division KSB1 bacterium]